jgi:CubicO group peptidase (beta-lactamase class C family)
MTPSPSDRIRTLLDHLVAAGDERGIQVAAYVNGTLVVDAAAGMTSADPRTALAVDRDTLFPVFSTTKGIAATALHLLAERGRVDYDTPLADLWPEFAAHGKQTLTVRHALSHTAGHSAMPAGIGHAELCDWQAMCAAIARQAPDSPPRRTHDLSGHHVQLAGR